MTYDTAEIIKSSSTVLDAVSFITGIIASILWYKAATITLPSYDTDPVSVYERGIYESMLKSSKLNAAAAWLTAISLFCTTLSNIISPMANRTTGPGPSTVGA